MASKSRTIDLVSKLSPEVFKLINKDIFGDTGQRLGSVQGAVTNMTQNHSDMLKVLMPTIINTSPDDSTWYKKVDNYWNSFGMIIPIGGRRLETGFTFSLSDTKRKVAITEITNAAKQKKIEIKTDDELMNYVWENVDENEKYKYATPINVADYLTWVYCLKHRKVAKHAEHLEKSTNIEFLLIDPKDIEDSRKANHVVSVEAMKKYLELLADRKKVKDILYIRGEDATHMADIDADQKLKIFVDTHPKEFLSIANDSTLNIKARIERYCISGILKRLANSSIIVDGLDNGILVGNTTDEAVVYFQSEAPDRVAKVKEFGTRYQQLVPKV